MLSVAFCTDILYKKIPNLLILTMIAGGSVYAFTRLSAADVLVRFTAAALIFGFLYLFYAIGAIGAGDIKLLMAISIYVDIISYGQIMLMSLVAAAIIALFRLIRKRCLMNRILYFCTYVRRCISEGGLSRYDNGYDNRDLTIPLAVPVFIGYTGWMALSILL